ncbi:MAG: FtsW/RodA/SpoVE family cell cycle protein [Patescibacteria group bacterium]|jgi:rod shape determining protein RodA
MAIFDFGILRRGDVLLTIGIGALVAFGFSAIFSIELSRGSENVFLQKQAIALGMGIVVSVLIASMNYHIMRYGARGLYMVGIFLLIAVLLFGRTLNGSTGWFVVGGFAFQPVEFMKVALVVVFAWYCSQKAMRRFSWRDLAMSGILVAIPVTLLMLQPDLGGAALLVGAWAIFILFAGIRVPQILAVCGLVLCVVSAGWFGVFDQYQKDRVLTFLDPSRDPLRTGYNVIQAKIAIGSGELWGRGLGDGSQSQLRFLPESQTDFIFAVIAEELGFVGVCLLFVAFILVFWRMIVLARSASDTFGAYICIGAFSVIFTEVIVHVGANVSLMPATGVALPFVSYGGSSLLLSFVFFGMVQSVAVRLHAADRVLL